MSTKSSSWRALLANPGPNGHIVQLYQDADFYGEAVSHFAAEGVVRGESIIIVATTTNWENIRGRLTSKGLVTADLLHRGQLTVLDADQALPEFLIGKLPDAKAFKSLAARAIAQARGGGKYPRVRWWGEMVNLLYINGNLPGSIRLEELFDEVADEESIAIFCSFLMDKYDPSIYERAFGEICRTHAHVIPVEDYAMHRETVDRAIGEVIGPIEGPLLRSLASWARGRVVRMPTSQSILLWVKHALPTKFDDVLACARKYESEALRAQQP